MRSEFIFVPLIFFAVLGCITAGEWIYDGIKQRPWDLDYHSTYPGDDLLYYEDIFDCIQYDPTVPVIHVGSGPRCSNVPLRDIWWESQRHGWNVVRKQETFIFNVPLVIRGNLVQEGLNLKYYEPQAPLTGH